LAHREQRDLAARVLRCVVQHPMTQRMAQVRCRRVWDDAGLGAKRLEISLDDVLAQIKLISIITLLIQLELISRVML
jgi:hypothetical protein